MFLLVLPFEWWMPRQRYQRLNDYVMGIIYSPLLLITAALETRTAFMVRRNRGRAAKLASRMPHREIEIPDDDSVDEWEELETEVDFESDGWAKRVDESCPNVVEKQTVVMIRELKKEIAELKDMLRGSTSGPGQSS